MTIESENLNKVPVIFGLCKDEGQFMAAPFYQEMKRWRLLTNNWQEWAPLLFFGKERELIRTEDQKAAQDIAEFYFGADTDMTTLPRTEEHLQLLGRIYSMAYFYSTADHDARSRKNYIGSLTPKSYY